MAFEGKTRTKEEAGQAFLRLINKSETETYNLVACAKNYIKSDPTLDTPAIVMEEFKALVTSHLDSLGRALPSSTERYARVAGTIAQEAYVGILLETQPEGWKVNFTLAVALLMENFTRESLERKCERLTAAVDASSLTIEEKEDVKKTIVDTKHAEFDRQGVEGHDEHVRTPGIQRENGPLALTCFKSMTAGGGTDSTRAAGP